MILGTIVTTAYLGPTKPLPPEKNYCDKCSLCRASCAAKYMADTTAEVCIGSHTYQYASRRSFLRCTCVCGGLTGLAPSGKWSTWSPGRFTIPETDDNLHGFFQKIATAYVERGIQQDGTPNAWLPGETVR